MEWGKLLKNIAPTIAAALPLPPPFGALASVAVKAALGVDQKAGDDDIAMALAKATPEQIIALKQQEQQLAIQLKQLDIDALDIAARDRDSARAREVSIRDKVPAILSTLITLGFFSVLAYILKYGVPVTGGEALLVLLGALGAGWGQVMNYYFGTSAGSAAKTDLLARAPAIK